MRSCLSHSFLSVSLLLLLGSTQTLAQLAFTNVPSTVNDGQSVQVSWTGGDGVNPVQVDLVQNGAVVDDEILDDEEGTPTTFTWSVDLDDDAVGGTYTLRLTSAGVTALSNPINIIDENGVGGPAPSAAAPSATGSAPAPTTAAGDVASTQPAQSSAGGSAATAASGGSSATGGGGSGGGGGSSSVPSTGIAASSASIAATASTLLTTTILGSALTITPEPTNTNDAAAASGSNTGSGSSGLSGGAIAGIVIGVLAIIALIVLALWFLRRRRANKTRTSNYTPGMSTFNSGSEKAGGNEYLQPSSFGVLGMRGGGGGGSHDPRSPNTTSDTGPSELHSSPTANTASEVHSQSLSPELPASRSVPANTYEMPASTPLGAAGAGAGAGAAGANQNLYEAPSGNEKVNSPQTAKSPGDQYQNFRSPVSELSSDGTTGTGTRSSYSDGGTFMSPVPRKAVGGFGGMGGTEERRGHDKYVV